MNDSVRSGKKFNIVVSILIAALLWFYVVNVENPAGSTTLPDVPVALQGVEELAARGLMVTACSRESFDLKVTGKRKTFLKLYQSSASVSLDVSGITEPGEWTLTGKAMPDWLRTDSGISVTEKHNFSVTVTVKKQESKEIAVQGSFAGTVANGFDADEIQISPSSLEVIGPEDVVESISHAVVELRGDNLKESLNNAVPFTLLDNEGNVIPQDSLIFSADTISVLLPIVKVYEIPLTVEFVSGGGATADDVTCTISPASITVSGQEELLEGISEISLGQIHLAEVFTNKNQNFKIPIPAGAENRSGVSEAAVNVSINHLPMKSIAANQIILTNIPEGYTATLVTDSLQVWVRGEEAKLNQVTSGNIRVLVDLSGANPVDGQQRAEAGVTITGISNVGVVGTDYSVAVILE